MLKSPNDRYSEMHHKVDAYLADGVQVVWVFDPQRKKSWCIALMMCALCRWHKRIR